MKPITTLRRNAIAAFILYTPKHNARASTVRWRTYGKTLVVAANEQNAQAKSG